MTDDANEMLQHLKEEYIKADYPSWQVWNFTPHPDTMRIFNELRAYGLIEQIGARNSPWRFTEKGLDFIMHRLQPQSGSNKNSDTKKKMHPNEAARQVLKVFYDIYIERGEERNWFVGPGENIFQKTGLTLEETQRAFNRLADKGLIKLIVLGGECQLLPAGVDAVEDSAILDSYLPVPETSQPSPKEDTVSVDPRKVFVVHGRNELARKAMFDLLRAMGLSPLEWNDAISHSGRGTPYVGQAIDAAFTVAKAVVVLLTGDDEVRLRRQFCETDEVDREKQFSQQARPNVLFEAGLAFGRHPDHTILVQIGNMRSVSDIAGLHIVRYAGRPDHAAEVKFRNDLANRLERAGCDVNRTGNDWMSAGRFNEALDLHNQQASYD